jgi:hypothetical protein
MDAEIPFNAGSRHFLLPALRPKRDGNMSNQSYTVDTFCEAERISRSMLYKLWSQGQGPRFFMVGTVRRISHEARLEWQRQMEAASVDGGA